jgi:aminopeptidase N
VIVLNAADLTINAASVDGIAAASFHLHPSETTLKVVPAGGQTLSAGTSIVLKIDFHAPLCQDAMKGLYHSSYVDAAVST